MSSSRVLRFASMTLSSGIALGCAQLASAQSLSYVNLTVTAGARYASNPFLVTGNDTGAASGDIEVRPQVRLVRERGQLAASAYYQRSEYSRRYGGTDGFGGDLSGSQRLNAKTTLTSSVNYVDSILVAADIFGTGANNATDPTTGAPLPTAPSATDPSLGDVGLIGTRQRRALLSASAGLNLTPSERDSLSFSLSGARSRYPGAAVGVSNYRQLGAGFSYSRRLSETRTLGARFNFSDVDYSRSNFASRVYSPELTVSQQIAGNWRLSAAAGASIIEQTDLALRSSSTSFSFSLDLCRNGEHSNFCLNASRSATSSGTDGVRPQTVARITYGYQFGEKTRLDLTGSYSRSGSTNVLGVTSQDYYYADASMSRQFGRRVSLVGGVSLQGVTDSGPSRSANAAARVGLSFSLGNRT